MFEPRPSDPGVADTRSPLRFLLWCARGQRRLLVAGSGFGVLWMVSQALIPLALGAALGAIVEGSRGDIVLWALVVLALGLGQAAAGVLRHRRVTMSFIGAAAAVEQLVVRQACALGGNVARRVASGEIANVGAWDVERIGLALDCVARFVGGVFSYALVAVVICVVSPVLGIVVVLGVPVAVLAVAPVMRPFQRRQVTERDRRSEASSIASDTVTGLRVLRGLGGERVFLSRYTAASQQVASATSRVADLQAVLSFIQVLLPGAIVVAITWIGAHLAVEGSISAGDLVAFYGSAAFLVIPMQTFVEAARKWTAGVVAARRVIALLTLEPDLAASPDATPPARAPEGDLLDTETGAILEAGRFTAVVAATPDEGTALLERLGRWRRPAPGARVTWGGRTAGAFDLAWYRAHVVMLERSPFHLRATVRESLLQAAGGLRQGDRTPGPALVEPEVSIRAALEAAQALELVEALPQGLDSDLSEQWRTISGGQRQRLSIAQVLSTGADVLLLDDPTSAVDAHTEAAVARGVARARRGRTTVVTTTSPLVAEQADLVVVLQGTARARAPHQALLLADPLYGAIVGREQ